jgi:hypothetical protein
MVFCNQGVVPIVGIAVLPTVPEPASLFLVLMRTGALVLSRAKGKHMEVVERRDAALT